MTLFYYYSLDGKFDNNIGEMVRSHPLQISRIHVAVSFSVLVYLLLYWRRLLLFGLIPFHVDTLCFYYPNWAIGKYLLKSGGYLLWDPFRNFGQPYLAVPQAQALYPLRILSPVLSYLDFIRLSVIFHSLLSGGFGYLWLRNRYRDDRAALMGGLVLGAGGLLFMRVVFQADFATIAWIPALLYFLSEKRPVPLGVCIALQWLAGYPPLFLITLLILIVEAGVEKPSKPFFTILAKAVLIGAGLSAVQSLPFLEMLGESVRPIFLDTRSVLINSLHPLDLLWELFVPGIVHYAYPIPSYYRATVYIGPFLFGLAIFGVVKGSAKQRWILGAAVAAMVLSLGYYVGFYPHVRFLHVFRYPGNWMLMAVVFIAELGAYGLSRVRRKRWRSWILAVIALDLLIYAWPARHPWGDSTFLERPATILPGLNRMRSGERVYHSESIMSAYVHWDEFNAKMWQTLKAIRLPSYGAAMGFREAVSHHNLTSRRVVEFRRHLYGDPSGKSELFDVGGVGKIVHFRAGREHVRVPSSDDFEVIDNPDAKRAPFMEASNRPVRVVSRKPGHITVEAEGPGRLVIPEAWYPGWQIEGITGIKKPEIFDNLLLSVNLPEGPNRVTFCYRPASFIIGLAISLLTLAFLLIWKIKIHI